MISRKGCPWLCRALAGGYRFKKTKEGGLKVIPEKNDPEGYSHIVDCLQYVCLIVHGGMTQYIYSRLNPPKTDARQRISATGWT